MHKITYCYLRNYLLSYIAVFLFHAVFLLALAFHFQCSGQRKSCYFYSIRELKLQDAY